MLKQQFIEELETIIKYNKNVFGNDKPAIRQLFNDHSDLLCKNGILTEAQYQRWILTDRELNKLLKISKG